MGFALVLFLTLLVSHTFYWTQSELIQALVLLLFFFGLVMKWGPIKFWQVLILVPFVPTIIFLHPLVFIPFIFLWIFILISPDFHKGYGFFILFGVFTLSLFWKHVVLSVGTYDSKSYKNAEGIFVELVNIFEKQSLLNFIHHCLTDYFFIIPLFFLVVTFYVFDRKWMKLFLFSSFFLGYLSLILLSYDHKVYQYHLESFYRVLVIFLVVPIVFDIWEKQEWRKVLVYALPLMVLVRLINITARHDVYSARIEWNKQLIEKVSK